MENECPQDPLKILKLMLAVTYAVKLIDQVPTLRKYMSNKKYSLREIARREGLCVSYLSRAMNGKTKLTEKNKLMLETYIDGLNFEEIKFYRVVTTPKKEGQLNAEKSRD